MDDTVDISSTIQQYGNTITVSGLAGASNMFSWIDETSTMTDKAEAAQMYMEAAGWLQIDEAGNLPEPEDTSEDWKITPMSVVDPALHDEWKKARLWMMDPLDDALGDDSMPALCSSCNGVYWGDQMMSIVTTIMRLRAKHDGSINGMLGNVWEETEPNVLNKLRANRMCKKCYTVSMEARANPWRESSDHTSPYQQNLPFVQSPTIIGGSSSITPDNSNVVVPTVTVSASGMAPPPGGWNISYSSTDDDI